MSWNPFDLFKTIDNGIALVSEAIEDKDLANQLKSDIEKLKQQVYMKELETRTIPWVDALHKMQRGILSVLSMIAGLIAVYMEVDPMSLVAIVGPASIYNGVKGKGK